MIIKGERSCAWVCVVWAPANLCPTPNAPTVGTRELELDLGEMEEGQHLQWIPLAVASCGQLDGCQASAGCVGSTCPTAGCIVPYTAELDADVSWCHVRFPPWPSLKLPTIYILLVGTWWARIDVVQKNVPVKHKSHNIYSHRQFYSTELQTFVQNCCLDKYRNKSVVPSII